MGILSDGYVMGDRIGKGGFGTVYKAIKKLTDRTVAVKKLERDKFPDRIEEEIRALERMRHRNIVQYYESFDEGGYKYIVMEYCEHGDLRSYLRRNGPLSDKEAAHVLSQLIDAVSYIHRQMLMHRDLSTGNVLISHITRGVDDDEVKLEVKLTDFGLATVMRPGTKGAAASVVGTPGFVAPQVYLENYSKEADVYSLGALLYSMTTGKSPPDIRPSRREPQAELDLRSLSPEAADLIERMMCKDHKRRIQLNEILKSAFMQHNFEVGQNPRGSFRSRDQPSKDSGNGSLPLRGASDRARQNESREPTRYVREPLVERRQMARRAESKEREECVGRGQPLAARRPSPSASTSCCRHSRADDHNGQCPGCGHRALPPTERSRCPSLLDTGRCGGRCQPAQRRRSLERDGERRSRERSYLGVSNVGASVRLTDLPPWPLVTHRLFPFMHSWKTGRYRLRDDQSVVGEFVDSGGIVSTIMVVRPSVQDGQVVTTCAPSRAVRIDDHSTEVVASDYRTERRFGSLEEMPQDVLTLYKKVVVFINNLGGRVVKVRHYPVQFPGAVCKVMENGDFLLCLKDGRVAMQKASGQLVQVTRGDKRASLTETEHSLFRNLRTDLLNFSRYAEQKSPALLPLVSGTPSPVSSPRSGPLATKEWQASTPLSRPGSVRSASASAPVRRANSTVGKENVSPANATREQIKIERTSSGSVAWLRWTATGNRLRVSQNDKSTLVYRLANGKEQRLKVDDDLPNDARQMLKFMLKMADQKTE